MMLRSKVMRQMKVSRGNEIIMRNKVLKQGK